LSQSTRPERGGGIHKCNHCSSPEKVWGSEISHFLITYLPGLLQMNGIPSFSGNHVGKRGRADGGAAAHRFAREKDRLVAYILPFARIKGRGRDNQQDAFAGGQSDVPPLPREVCFSKRFETKATARTGVKEGSDMF